MNEMTQFKKKVDESASFLQKKIRRSPRIALILGTGLGGLVEKFENSLSIAYEDIPHFPNHKGNLIYGLLAGKEVVALQGRFHFYEGYSTRELTFPVRVLSLCGTETLIATNAAGGLNSSYSPGTVMIIRDHLNLLGENPLRGPNVEEWGPRFPDLSEPYDKTLLEMAINSANRSQISNVVTGTYAAVPGPSLETPAETRYLKLCGADGVGMSTVPEVIVAKHAGMRVLGVSLIANVNNPDDFTPILLDEVIKNTESAAPRLQKLVEETIKEIE